MSQSETPASLARELGISQKRIRDFLRKEYGKLKPFETRWQLDPGKAAAVRRNFS